MLAISTLLQAPIVRTGLKPHTTPPPSSAHKAPTARDIPPVNLTNIPHVDASKFNAYLAQVGNLYDALQQTKEDARRNAKSLKTTSEPSGIADGDAQHASRDIAARHGSLASIASPTEPFMPKRRTSRSKQASQIATPLSTIPSVYFEEGFHLENPRTFDVVSERSEVVKPSPGSTEAPNKTALAPRKALATNSILQEKLSWYMDTVEVHLISSISLASNSFFSALGSLRDLHHEAAESVSRIKCLRTNLEKIDAEVVVGGLRVLEHRRKGQNIKTLSSAMEQMRRIVESLRNCEKLVDDGQVDKALTLIARTERMTSGEESTGTTKSQTFDLRGVNALQGVTTTLDALRNRVGKVFEARLLDLLLSDLRNHVECVSAEDTLQRWSKSSQGSRGSHTRDPSTPPAYMVTRPELRTELFTILTGLENARHIIPATAAYRDAVLREMRGILKRHMPSSSDDDADSIMSSSTTGMGKTRNTKSSILARNLRALDPEDAEVLLTKTYIGVGETMRRLGTQVKILLDVTSLLGEPHLMGQGLRSPPRSPRVGPFSPRLVASPQGPPSVQEEIHQILDIHNLLGQAVDLAQDKMSRVLKVRAEQSVGLSMEMFLRYFTLNLLFANECEAVSGRSGTALKAVVNLHIKDFVRDRGEHERQVLANGMEADPWNAKDFSENDTEQLERILLASTQNVRAWSQSTQIWRPAAASPQPLSAQSLMINGNHLNIPNGNASSGPNTGTSTPSGRASVRSASIPPHSFLLPLSATLCLHGLSHLLHLTTCIPSLTAEISSTIISYLTLFNSRTTQLILGAGATRSSAGLKNITTKHLALALQALTFIGTLIPHVREAIRRLAPGNISVSQSMNEFERCRRMVSEHEEQIRDKFGDIMRGRGLAHVKSFRALDWQDMPPKEGANAYMETLCKETITLHKVLSKHLPSETVASIMQPVWSGYKSMLGRAYEEQLVPGEGPWQRYVKAFHPPRPRKLAAEVLRARFSY